MSKFYMIPNSFDLEEFNEELILPLEGFSIGFDVYFNVDKIKEISKTRKINVLINRFLHKEDLINIKSIIKEIDDVINYYFVEDLGLSNILPKEKVVIFQNHIINNYDAVNTFSELGFNKIVVNNDLTIDELTKIKDKTNSELFIFSINKNNLMYSRRLLLSSYYDFKSISDEKTKLIKERVSKKDLIIKEEDKGTCIFNEKLFSCNKYLDELEGFNFIINFSNMSEFEKNIILSNYKNKDLNEKIEVDEYFLDNEIIYKVGLK